MRHVSLVGRCALLWALVAFPWLEAEEPGRQTLRGQVVCSSCWTEADRSKVAYGGPSDLECAERCRKKGIPAALAIREGDRYRLVTLAEGAFRKTGRGWMTYMARYVEVSGAVSGSGDATRIRVDTVTPVDDPAGAGRPLGMAAPEISAVDLAGVEQRLSALRGRIVVLNFWATWCGPCREEMPGLSETSAAYAAWGVQVVGLAADPAAKRDVVAKFVREKKVGFAVWLGADLSQMDALGLGTALPATVVLDREGRVAARFRGVVTKGELAKAIDALLREDEKKAEGDPATGGIVAGRAASVPS